MVFVYYILMQKVSCYQFYLNKKINKKQNKVAFTIT